MANNPPPFAILLVILLFLCLTPDPPTPGESHRHQHAVAHERGALEALNNSTFGDLRLKKEEDAKPLNLTGFRPEHGFHWELLETTQGKARDQARYALGENADSLLEEGSDQYPLLYHNVTGFLEGEWRRTGAYDGPHVNLSAITPHGTYASEDWKRNVTATSGDVRIHFREKENGEAWNTSVRRISARATISQETSFGTWWEMILHGIHFVDVGEIILTTTSEKFDGIFGLPHLALSNHTFNLSRDVLNRTLNETIEKQKTGMLEDSAPWSSTMEGEDFFSVPHCEYVFYFQQHPVPLELSGGAASGNALVLHHLEEELRFPHRPFLPKTPDMIMSMVAFSPDCGFTIESKGPPDLAPQEGQHLKGPKTEAYAFVARRHVLLFTAIISAQLILLLRQMKEASTPSTRSRISFFTIAILALGDGFALLGFALFGMQIESTTMLLLATAYVAFLSVIFFGMGFLKEIWTVQSTERSREERQQTANSSRATNSPETTQPGSRSQTPAAPPAAPVLSAAGAETLPLPVTARQAINSGATPIIIPSDQDIDAEIAENQNNDANGNNQGSPRRGFGSVYLRFYLLLFGLVFLSLHATTWPASVQSVYSSILTFAYMSFLVPQIYRNVMRNCRKALRWDFVVGQSVLRLLPFAYLYAYKGNILLIEPDLHFLAVLCGWVWLQVCALLSQEHLGPRFFVRDSWVPPAYDYHPVLRADEEGASLPSGAKVLAGEEAGMTTTTKAGESRDKSKKIFDCAICMQDLEVPVIASAADADGAGASGLSGGLLARRAYMVTPCRHIFHSVCLEGWMRYRLQCPICREVLPPL
ncbi:putative RING finger ubiquitin ligase [Phyllosticta citricarpa]|uniref:RING-type E3 ubiquitin transferase n=1 Tax=Phyllosticta paracitricarpa TaxID=2016321 RepID=A0ABR1MWK3_9PEZI